MKKNILFTIAFSLLSVVLIAQINPNIKPEPTQARPITVAEFHTFIADNNMKVFLIRKPGYPLFRISIDPGIPLIPEETQPELRRVMSAIFSKGSSKYSSEQMKKISDYYAATVIGTLNGISCSGMNTQIDTLMKVAATYFTFPAINDSIVKKETEKGLQDFLKKGNSKKDSKYSFASKLIDSLRFYINQKDDHAVEETAKGYENITTESVKKYFEKYYNPDNSYCIMSGDFTIEQANKLLCKYFEGWKSGTKISSNYTNSFKKNFPTSRKIYVVDNPLAVQSKVSVRWPIGDAFPYSANEPLFMVLNQVFGAGYMSNLNQNIRLDKGLSYGANNIMSIDIYGGFCCAQTNVRNSETAYALENILFEMLRMRNELPSKETLDMAKNGLIGDFARSMSKINSPAIIGFGMVRDKYNLPDDYLSTYPLKIEAITADDIRKASQKYIRPYECVILIEGKVEDLKGKLEKFGSVEYYSEKGIRIE